MGKADTFFSAAEQHEILQAIRAAEHETSGEVRVHIEQKSRGNAYTRAISLFHKLGMHRTAQRNGVLIYLALKDKAFAIIGDKGIDEKVPEDFWEEVKEEMRRAFADGKFLAGLCSGIGRAGEKLKEFFPYRDGDVNELSDTISFGDD